jgi:hypothetical protein
VESRIIGKVRGVAFDNQISENPALKFILNLA